MGDYKCYIQRAIIHLIFSHMKEKNPLSYVSNNIINASVSFFNSKEFDPEFIKDFNEFLLDEEGYKFIKILDNFGILGYLLPEVALLKKVQQHKKNGQNALEHTILVLKHIKLTFNDPIVMLDANKSYENNLKWATLLHDIGKYYTQTKENGKTHFFFHENKSAEMAVKILTKFGFQEKDINHICNIIKYHMWPLNFQREGEWSEKALRNFVETCSKYDKNDVYAILELAIADKRASTSNPEYLKPLLKFKDDVYEFFQKEENKKEGEFGALPKN